VDRPPRPPRPLSRREVEHILRQHRRLMARAGAGHLSA